MYWSPVGRNKHQVAAAVCSSPQSSLHGLVLEAGLQQEQGLVQLNLRVGELVGDGGRTGQLPALLRRQGLLHLRVQPHC